MNDLVEPLVAGAVGELGRHEYGGPAGVALWALFGRYRHRRDGFTGAFEEAQVQGYFASPIVVPDLSPDDLAEIVGDIDRAVGGEPHGRRYLAALLRWAEEPRLTTPLLDLLARMWDDPPAHAHPAVAACRFAQDGPELRSVLVRWADRDDDAGDEARDLLSELMSPLRDFTSFDDLLREAMDDIQRGATSASAVFALNHLLAAAVRDVPGKRREARRFRSTLRDVCGPSVAGLRPTPTEVRDALTRIESETPHTRRATRALVAAIEGIGSEAAVPALLATLRRIGSLPANDRSGAYGLVRDLLAFRDRPDVAAALSEWREVVKDAEEGVAIRTRVAARDPAADAPKSS